MRVAVQIRLMSDDPRAVEAAVALLKHALPDSFNATGSAPNRRGPGQRGYGLLLVELPEPRESTPNQGEQEL